MFLFFDQWISIHFGLNGLLVVSVSMIDVSKKCNLLAGFGFHMLFKGAIFIYICEVSAF